MRPTSVEVFDVASGARGRRLFALRTALTALPAFKTLLDRPAEDIEAALDSPLLDCWTALLVGTVRRGEQIDTEIAAAGLRLIADGAGALKGPALDHGPTVLGDSDWARKLVGDASTFPIAPAAVAARAFECASATVARILPSRLERIRAGVTTILGLEGPSGSVCGFSSEDWPGLVAFNVQAAPLLLAEEVIHEITHIAVAACLRGEGGRWLRRMPGLFSSFTDSIRPAERLAHGILAYREVVTLWRVSEEHLAADPALVDATSVHAAHLLRKRRIAVIEDRVARAEAELFCCFSSYDVEAWSALCERAHGFVVMIGNSQKPATSDLARLRAAGLNDIEQAEVVLALDGIKVSRIGVAPSAVPELHRAVGPGHVVFGDVALIPLSDPKLGGFSNESAEELPLDNPRAAQGQIQAYIAREAMAARRCFELDLDDEAGGLLAIPACCQAWFASNWPLARARWGGDLASLLASAVAQTCGCVVRPDWRANPFAMYFGGGLCWHFPCSFDCEPTSRCIAEREQRLRMHAPQLADTLVAVQRLPLMWTERHGVAALPNRGPLDRARWLLGAGPDEHLGGLTVKDLECPDVQARLTCTLGRWLLLRWGD